MTVELIDIGYYIASMDLEQFLLTLAMAAVALFVFLACVCRLRFLHQAHHKGVWVQSYYLLAFGAGWTGVECWVVEVHVSQLLLLLGAALWLWGSRMSWRTGPPKYLER